MYVAKYRQREGGGREEDNRKLVPIRGNFVGIMLQNSNIEQNLLVGRKEKEYVVIVGDKMHTRLYSDLACGVQFWWVVAK